MNVAREIVVAPRQVSARARLLNLQDLAEIPGHAGRISPTRRVLSSMKRYGGTGRL